MNIFTITFILVLVSSTVCIINANQQKRYPNNVLRERFLDHLLEAKREALLHDEQRGLHKQFQRRHKSFFNNDDDNNYQRTYVRRKAVGLGDNPFK